MQNDYISVLGKFSFLDTNILNDSLPIPSKDKGTVKNDSSAFKRA
jgi:hypothetical protein